MPRGLIPTTPEALESFPRVLNSQIMELPKCSIVFEEFKTIAENLLVCIFEIRL